MSMKALNHREIKHGDQKIDLFEPEGLFGTDQDVLDGFMESVKQLVLSGRKEIRVSCKLMTSMNSTGVGVMLRAWALAKQHGVRLKVDSQGNRRIHRIMVISNLPFKDESDDGETGAPPIPPPAPPKKKRE
jgi:anti-anti-sigma regulatory factor